MDELPVRCVHGGLCVHVLLLLLLLQNQVSRLVSQRIVKQTLEGSDALVVCFRMYGLFQTSFYFGYMAVFSTALGIMCGELSPERVTASELNFLFAAISCYS